MRPHFQRCRLPLLAVATSRRIITRLPAAASSSFLSLLSPGARVVQHLGTRSPRTPLLLSLYYPTTTTSSIRTMATLTVSPSDELLRLITSSFSNLSLTTTESPDAQTSYITLPNNDVVAGTNTVTTYLSPQLFPNITYSDVENAEIGQWLTVSALNQDNPTQKYLETLNSHLKTRTTILGEKPSVADLAVYVRIKEHIRKWDSETRTGGERGGWRYIVRWADYVQNAPSVFGIKVPETQRKVPVDVNDVKVFLKSEEPAKEKKDIAAGEAKGEDGKIKKKSGGKEKKDKGVVEAVKEKAEKVVEGAKGAAAPAITPDGGKKDKKKEKEKKEKAPAPKKEEPVISPSLIDLRVGQILKCVPHPNADSLFMSTVICGDTPDSPYINTPYPDPSLPPNTPPTRTVLSGLRGKIPIEEMQGRKVVLVCNLKPANMRGIKSSAMVLAASPRDTTDPHGGVVELAEPPAEAEIGERLVFEGYSDGEALPQLNPKMKVMELVGPGFGTNEEGIVVFESERVYTGAEGEQNDKKLARGTGRLVSVKSGGVCKVKSLKGALVR